MAWPKGKPRPEGAGRKKGVGNKNNIRHDLHAQCEARGINVFELLLDFCGEAPPELRLNAIKELMKYLHPQKRAIDVSGEVKNPFLEKTVEELEILIREKLKK